MSQVARDQLVGTALGDIKAAEYDQQHYSNDVYALMEDYRKANDPMTPEALDEYTHLMFLDARIDVLLIWLKQCQHLAEVVKTMGGRSGDE